MNVIKRRSVILLTVLSCFLVCISAVAADKAPSWLSADERALAQVQNRLQREGKRLKDSGVKDVNDRLWEDFLTSQEKALLTRTGNPIADKSWRDDNDINNPFTEPKWLDRMEFTTPPNNVKAPGAPAPAPPDSPKDEPDSNAAKQLVAVIRVQESIEKFGKENKDAENFSNDLIWQKLTSYDRDLLRAVGNPLANSKWREDNPDLNPFTTEIWKNRVSALRRQADAAPVKSRGPTQPPPPPPAPPAKPATKSKTTADLKTEGLTLAKWQTLNLTQRKAYIEAGNANALSFAAKGLSADDVLAEKPKPKQEEPKPSKQSSSIPNRLPPPSLDTPIKANQPTTKPATKPVANNQQASKPPPPGAAPEPPAAPPESSPQRDKRSDDLHDTTVDYPQWKWKELAQDEPSYFRRLLDKGNKGANSYLMAHPDAMKGYSKSGDDAAAPKKTAAAAKSSGGCQDPLGGKRALYAKGEIPIFRSAGSIRASCKANGGNTSCSSPISTNSEGEIHLMPSTMLASNVDTSCDRLMNYSYFSADPICDVRANEGHSTMVEMKSQYEYYLSQDRTQADNNMSSWLGRNNLPQDCFVTGQGWLTEEALLKAQQVDKHLPHPDKDCCEPQKKDVKTKTKDANKAVDLALNEKGAKEIFDKGDAIIAVDYKKDLCKVQHLANANVTLDIKGVKASDSRAPASMLAVRPGQKKIDGQDRMVCEIALKDCGTGKFVAANLMSIGGFLRNMGYSRCTDALRKISYTCTDIGKKEPDERLKVLRPMNARALEFFKAKYPELRSVPDFNPRLMQCAQSRESMARFNPAMPNDTFCETDAELKKRGAHRENGYGWIHMKSMTFEDTCSDTSMPYCKEAVAAHRAATKGKRNHEFEWLEVGMEDLLKDPMFQKFYALGNPEHYEQQSMLMAALFALNYKRYQSSAPYRKVIDRVIDRQNSKLTPADSRYQIPKDEFAKVLTGYNPDPCYRARMKQCMSSCGESASKKCLESALSPNYTAKKGCGEPKRSY